MAKIALTYVTENIWSGSLAYKDTLEKQHFIDSEPKGEVISSKTDPLGAIYPSKIQLDVAGSIFEPHPTNFVNQPIF